MIDIDVSQREQTPRWIDLGAPVLTIFLALFAGSFILLSVGINPVTAYLTMLVQPLTTFYGITQILLKLVPILMAGLAVYLPLRAGIWNIGAGGQIFVGGITATVIALSVDAPALVIIPLMMIGAAVVGGLWGFVPGYLKAKWGVDEIIVSLMLTFIGSQINDYMVRGPLQGDQNFPASAVLPDPAMLPSIPGTGIHAGLLFPVLAAVGIYYLVQRSKFGVEMALIASNPEAAEQAGISKMKIYVTVFVLAGAIAGIAGMAIISGTQQRLRPGFELGYGYTGIPIALLGKNGVSRVVLAAVTFSLIFVGGSFLTTSLGVPAPFTDILEALIILFLITAEFVRRYEVTLEFGPTATPSATTAPEEEI
jgi:simple sugar transport system permease protein